MSKSSPVVTVTLNADAKDVKKGTQEAAGAFEGFGAAATGVIAGVTAAVTSMALDVAKQVGAMVADAIVATNDAQAKIQAQLGLTAEEAEKYAGIAGDIYANAWGESVGEVTDSLALVKQALGDISDEELEDITTKALAMSDVFGVDVTESVDAARSMVSNGLAPDAATAFDILTAGFQGGGNAAGDLLDTFREYPEAFETLGIDGAEAMAMIDAAMDAGARNTDLAADALKEFGIRAQDGSEATGLAYKSIGLDAADMAQKIAAGGESAEEAFRLTVYGLSQITDPVAREAAGVALFGTQWEDLGFTAIAAMAGAEGGVEDFKGTADEMAKAAGSSWSSQFESFKRKALQAIAEYITTTLIPAVQKFVAWIQENWPAIRDAIMPVVEGIVAWFQANWPQIQQVVMDVMVSVQTIITDVLTIVQTLWDTFGEIVLTHVTEKFEAILKIIEGVMKAIQGIIEIITGLITGDWEKAWDGVKQLVEGVWLAIRGIIESVLSTIKAYLQAAWIVIQAVAEAAWNAVKAAISAAWEGIKSVVSGAIETVKSTISGAWETIKSGASSAWETFKSTISGVWDSIKTTVSTAISDILSYIAGIPGGVATAIGSGFEAIWTNFKSFYNKIADAVNGWKWTFSFTLPKISTPFGSIGGNTVGPFTVDPIPFSIPKLHTGGVVPGQVGQEALYLLEAGERVIPRNSSKDNNSGGTVINYFPQGYDPQKVKRADDQWTRWNAA